MFGFTLLGDVLLVVGTAVAVWIFKDTVKAWLGLKADAAKAEVSKAANDLKSKL